MYDFKISREQIAQVVVKNKKNALLNENAIYGEKISVKDVLTSEILVEPLHKLDIAESIDGAACVIVASERAAKKLTKNPLWIEGIGWTSSSSSEFCKDIASAEYIEKSAISAYRMAGIKFPDKEIDFVECDDRFSYKELQHISSLKIFKKDKDSAGKLLEKGYFDIVGQLPVNPSGGLLGIGNLHSGAGLLLITEASKNLLGLSKAQIELKNKRAIVCSWCGLPSRSGGVVVLNRG